jgi:hypothetical protein
MTSIQKLCLNSIYLNKGIIEKIGETSLIIKSYFQQDSNTDKNFLKQNLKSSLVVREIISLDYNLLPQNIFEIGQNLILKVDLESSKVYKNLMCQVRITNEMGVIICSSLNADSRFDIPIIEHKLSLLISFLDVRFYPGRYFISFFIGIKGENIELQNLEQVINFEILGGGDLTSRKLPSDYGLLFLTPEWRII